MHSISGSLSPGNQRHLYSSLLVTQYSSAFLWWTFPSNCASQRGQRKLSQNLLNALWASSTYEMSTGRIASGWEVWTVTCLTGIEVGAEHRSRTWCLERMRLKWKPFHSSAMAPGSGIEPVLVGSKSTVLPLDDPGIYVYCSLLIDFWNSKYFSKLGSSGHQPLSDSCMQVIAFFPQNLQTSSHQHLYRISPQPWQIDVSRPYSIMVFRWGISPHSTLVPVTDSAPR